MDTFKKVLSSLVFLCLLFSLETKAEYYPTVDNGVLLRDIDLSTESGGDSSLSKIVQKDKAVILVPAYFSCNSTCPLIAENLKKALAVSGIKDKFSVVFLSFDVTNTPEDIQRFRKNHDLPQEMTLSVVKEEAAVRKYFEPLSYTFQKTEQGFDHPNSFFIFSPISRKWVGTVIGVDIKPSDLGSAISDANLQDSSGVKSSVLKLLKNPTSLLIIGLSGFLLSTIFVLYWAVLRKRNPTDANV